MEKTRERDKREYGVGGRNIGRMTQYVEEVISELARFTGMEMDRMVEMV